MDKQLMDKLIQGAKDFYLNSKVPEIPDKEYDELLARAKTEDPNFNIFEAIDLDRQKAKHDVKFQDLHKVQIDRLDFEKHRKFLNGLESKGYLSTPKMSGCSIVAYYSEDGFLRKIITKSNDSYGSIKTKSLYQKFPYRVEKGIKAIDAEAIVDLRYRLGGLSEAKANGLVNSVNDPAQVKKMLTMVVWDVIPYPEYKDKRGELFNSLKNLRTADFRVVDPKPFKVDELSWDKEYQGDGFRCLIDGYVIYDKSHKLICALKFYYTEFKDVKIKRIEWNVSDKLAYIPKIQFDPVKIDGVTIKQCASNGIMTLIENKISEGSIIRVARVNSSSPQMVGVIEAKGFHYPKCPACGTLLNEKDIIKSTLHCSNPLCKDKLNWVSRHIGNITLEKVEKNPDKYSILAVNLSSFNPNKKRKKAWKPERIERLITCFEDKDARGFYELLKECFDLNPENKQLAKRMTDAVVTKVNEKLFE